MPLLRRLKSRVVPAGSRPRRLLAGINRGLRMELDLQSDAQRWLGLSERELARCLRGAHDLDTGIDVGANDGYYALFMLARTGARRVFAFEPDARALARMRENLALNRLATDGRLVLTAKLVGAVDDAHTATLDSIVDDVGASSLVKVDVEGAELDVLRGADRLLRRTGVRWLIETHSADLERACVAELEKHGYQTQIIDHAWWRAIVPEHRPTAHNRWLFAVRPGSASATAPLSP